MSGSARYETTIGPYSVEVLQQVRRILSAEQLAKSNYFEKLRLTYQSWVEQCQDELLSVLDSLTEEAADVDETINIEYAIASSQANLSVQCDSRTVKFGIGKDELEACVGQLIDYAVLRCKLEARLD